MAKQFEGIGAGAIMVQTLATSYHSSLADLTRISLASKVPVIRQDYIYDEYQIVEARAAGADAVLAASIFHFGDYTIAQAKAHMAAAGIPMRLT